MKHIYSKVTGWLMVRRETPLQSRPSQGYWIANAQPISSLPGGPDHVLDLSTPPGVPGPAGAQALVSPSAPAGVQLALGLASGLQRAGQPEGPGSVWPGPSGLSALSSLMVRELLVHEDLTVVVCRPSLAGFCSTRGWPPVSGGRPHPQGHTGLQASGGPQLAPQPVPSVCRWLSHRPPHGPVGRLSQPGGFRLGPAPRHVWLPHGKCPVAAAAPA